MKRLIPFSPLPSVFLLWFSVSTYADEVRRFVHQNQTVIGRPLHWDTVEQRLTVIGNDGAMRQMDAEQALASEKISQPFRSQSQAEMRASLIQEFGSRFQVTGTGNYLVVHPRGDKANWAQRFESLFRQMQRYFSVRGISLHPPAFPLVAVVFPTQQEFMQYSRDAELPVSPAILGFYNINSNRILLFDVTAGGKNQRDWRTNAETIIHEAAHQTAFNVGIHNRFSPPPRWIGEGLGTLFEARGVYDSVTYPNLLDRVNSLQLQAYRRRVGKRLPANVLKALVATDDLFRYAPDSAYAISWAATLMFAEQQPQDLARYLQITAGKQPFSEPAAAERIRDFERAFGNDYEMIAARIQRFIDSLPNR